MCIYTNAVLIATSTSCFFYHREGWFCSFKNKEKKVMFFSKKE